MTILQALYDSALVRVVRDHYGTLPRYGHARRAEHNRPWFGVVLFAAVPIAAAFFLGRIDSVMAKDVPNSLLAAVGVLAGVLVQVLAWIAGRIGSLADTPADVPPTKRRLRLLSRLRQARVNIAYASLFCTAFAIVLAVQATIEKPAEVFVFIDRAAVIHLGLTLLIVLIRINSIGQTDDLIARNPEQSNTSTNLTG